jgi:hypothetical protein
VAKAAESEVARYFTAAELTSTRSQILRRAGFLTVGGGFQGACGTPKGVGFRKRGPTENSPGFIEVIRRKLVALKRKPRENGAEVP